MRSAATTTTTYDERVTSADRRRLLRRIIAGAAAFDAALGVVCLIAAGELGDWLSISATVVRETGAVFLVAALVGAETALRKTLDVRWIVGANVVFALWCVAVIAFDDPDGIGAGLLAVSAVAALGTALLEWRVAKTT